ncbi:hypothetical protein CDD82_1646 [Ophiocordyceps australis]|uniref:Uncharacterized protein n=1 Tax=Ophiocordyceps australis TaxID=1399860 RepID=A0A2C5ZMI5_9HYPO|nr:hypothetical protein CDD82_1646 [Ophiocordyceps australis]
MLQGLQYIRCLRGIETIKFYDYAKWFTMRASWLEDKEQFLVRNKNFSLSVAAEVGAPKDEHDYLESRLGNLPPLLKDHEPTSEEWQALRTVIGREQGYTQSRSYSADKPSHSFLRHGSTPDTPIVIEDDSQWDSDNSDSEPDSILESDGKSVDSGASDDESVDSSASDDESVDSSASDDEGVDSSVSDDEGVDNSIPDDESLDHSVLDDENVNSSDSEDNDLKSSNPDDAIQTSNCSGGLGKASDQGSSTGPSSRLGSDSHSSSGSSRLFVRDPGLKHHGEQSRKLGSESSSDLFVRSDNESSDTHTTDDDQSVATPKRLHDDQTNERPRAKRRRGRDE